MDEFTLLKFTKEFQAFLAGDATLVSLTSYNASTNRSILVDSGEQQIAPPSAIIVLDSTVPWLSDLDSIFDSLLTVHSYSKTRVDSMKIAMAVYNKCKQVDHFDAGFNNGDIETLSMMPLGFPQDAGQSQGLQPESVRRTERSDVPIADRHITKCRIFCRWRDTRAL